MSTFRALVNIPKAQLKGSPNKRAKQDYDNAARNKVAPMAEPRFKTAIEITRATLAGQAFDPSYPNQDLYVIAKKWAAYERSLKPFRFFKKGSTKPQAGTHNFCIMQGCR